MAPNALVIHGDTDQGEVLCLSLQRLGFKTNRSETGQWGTILAQQAHPDVILVGWALKDEPGIETCKRIKRAEHQNGVSALLMLLESGTPDEELASLRAGADGYVRNASDELQLGLIIGLHMQKTRFLRRLHETNEDLRQTVGQLRKQISTAIEKRILSPESLEPVLKTEWSRAKRYGGALSMILAELDRIPEGASAAPDEAGELASETLPRVLLSTTRIVDRVARCRPVAYSVVLPHTPIDGAWIVAERLQEGFLQEMEPAGGEQAPFALSCGIVGLPAREQLFRRIQTPGEWLEWATEALRVARGTGVGNIHSFGIA